MAIESILKRDGWERGGNVSVMTPCWVGGDGAGREMVLGVWVGFGDDGGGGGGGGGGGEGGCGGGEG